MSLLLREKGGEVHNYDPLFFADKNLLGQQYDVVTSTEVVEHFKEPKTDWDQLIHLIKPRGLLAVMTQFLVEDVDYQTWWYKNDPTHVAFYNENTFEFLAKKYGLEILFNDHVSVIIFRKK